MAKRKLGPFSVAGVGLGCMSLSYAYGTPPSDAEGERLLHRALDLGYDFLDTAALYGVGHNETLIGRALKARRGEFALASKCGIRLGEGGIKAPRVLDGSRAGVTAVLDESLARLGVDHIDLYYLHRLDPKTPIEESVGALADAVHAGKIGAIGLSEVSAATLRRAAAVARSPRSRPNIRCGRATPSSACSRRATSSGRRSSPSRRSGAGSSPGRCRPVASLPDGDIRRTMPRFRAPNLGHNEALLAECVRAVAPRSATPRRSCASRGC